MSNPFMHDESDIAERVYWKMQNAKSQCSIGKIVTLNSSPLSVDIQPLVRYFDPIAGWQDYPVLKHVPLGQFQTEGGGVKLPLVPGNLGMILWFDREVYTCLTAGATSVTTPDSGSLDDQNACIFLPLVQVPSKGNPIAASGVDFVSKYQGTTISFMTELNLLLQALDTFVQGVQASTDWLPLQLAASTFLNTLTPTLPKFTQFKGQQP